MAGDADILRGRHLTGIADLSADEMRAILACASSMKQGSEPDTGSCAGKSLALVFEKPSLRTRVTFEVAMSHLGGHAVYLAPADISIGQRESIGDVAQNLSRWVDAIAARTFEHSTVTELARYATIPVINALSNLEHPCQALADLMTIWEHKCKSGQRDFRSLKLVFVGDGNNVANSLLLTAAKVGMSMTVACPPGYEPNVDILRQATDVSRSTGAAIEIASDPRSAAADADAIYTDIWASMGQEEEAEHRKLVFASFQVDSTLMKAARPDAIFLHCLPAHREEEVTSEVLDGAQSVVLDQAENRLHVQKALLAQVM